MIAPMKPLSGSLVVDLTRYLPGPFASRELLRYGARVVRLESPSGDPLRTLAPAWDQALNAGKESVVCDLKREPELGRALCARADVVLEGFRPGVAARLGIGAENLPEQVVYCSITGFGSDPPHASRAGHDLNYVGYAGLLADTTPSVPPVQIADLGAGALAAVAEVLAALLERGRTGRGACLELSMTHGAHRLGAHRLGGEPLPAFLTGGLACYRIYGTSDGRFLTVAALEEQFFRRFCELLERPDLIPRQYDPNAQDELAAELASIIGGRELASWLDLFQDEDVAVGPVATLEEAARDFGSPVPAGTPPGLGEHTERWRADLCL
jgi:crotonobetainyl-CoA:carnitine CoA-transferase CaiB-like acyl-CoA transferase